MVLPASSSCRGERESSIADGFRPVGGRREDAEVGYGGESEKGRNGGDGGGTRDEKEREGG